MRVKSYLTSLVSFSPSWENMIFMNKRLLKYRYGYVVLLSFLDIYLQYDHFLYFVI